MKLVSYTHCGQAGFGAVVGEGVVDLTNRIGPGVDSIKSMLEAEAMDVAAERAASHAPGFVLSDLALLPVIPNPGKILCIGLNYQSHKAEAKRPDVDHPTIFTRFADSQVGHRQAMIKPAISDRFDFEGEMAVIIGRPGRSVPEDRALDHVAGYACYNDGSVRDWQRHTFQFTPGKNFPGTGAFGPYLVTSDEVGDYTQLPIQTRLNGEIMQDATLADLIFPVPRLIAYISQFTPLAPGDVIVSGTPGGVGDRRDPPRYMTPGDWIEVEIGCLGTLANPIMAES